MLFTDVIVKSKKMYVKAISVVLSQFQVLKLVGVCCDVAYADFEMLWKQSDYIVLLFEFKCFYKFDADKIEHCDFYMVLLLHRWNKNLGYFFSLLKQNLLCV